MTKQRSCFDPQRNEYVQVPDNYIEEMKKNAVQYQLKRPTFKIRLNYVDPRMLVIGNIVKIEETEHYLKLIFTDGKEKYISHLAILTFDVEEEVYDDAKDVKAFN